MKHAATILSLLLFAAPALAQTPTAAIVTGDSSRLLEQEIRLELGGPRSVALPELDARQDLRHDLRPAEAAPEELRLDWRAHRRITLYLAADMTGQLARLDAVDDWTYFTVGAEFALTPSLRLFVEDFQPSSAVLGEEVDELEPVSDMSWDGHQLGLGGRFQVTDRVRLDGAVIFYVLSAAHRDDGVGARGGLVLEF